MSVTCCTGLGVPSLAMGRLFGEGLLKREKDGAAISSIDSPWRMRTFARSLSRRFRVLVNKVIIRWTKAIFSSVSLSISVYLVAILPGSCARLSTDESVDGELELVGGIEVEAGLSSPPPLLSVCTELIEILGAGEGMGVGCRNACRMYCSCSFTISCWRSER